jgi:hypothetical protein
MMVYKGMKVHSRDIDNVIFLNNDTAFVLYIIEGHGVVVVDRLSTDRCVDIVEQQSSVGFVDRVVVILFDDIELYYSHKVD